MPRITRIEAETCHQTRAAALAWVARKICRGWAAVAVEPRGDGGVWRAYATVRREMR